MKKMGCNQRKRLTCALSFTMLVSLMVSAAGGVAGTRTGCHDSNNKEWAFGNSTAECEYRCGRNEIIYLAVKGDDKDSLATGDTACGDVEVSCSGEMTDIDDDTRKDTCQNNSFASERRWTTYGGKGVCSGTIHEDHQSGIELTCWTEDGVCRDDPLSGKICFPPGTNNAGPRPGVPYVTLRIDGLVATGASCNGYGTCVPVLPTCVSLDGLLRCWV